MGLIRRLVIKASSRISPSSSVTAVKKGKVEVVYYPCLKLERSETFEIYLNRKLLCTAYVPLTAKGGRFKDTSKHPVEYEDDPRKFNDQIHQIVDSFLRSFDSPIMAR